MKGLRRPVESPTALPNKIATTPRQKTSRKRHCQRLHLRTQDAKQATSIMPGTWLVSRFVMLHCGVMPVYHADIMPVVAAVVLALSNRRTVL